MRTLLKTLALGASKSLRSSSETSGRAFSSMRMHLVAPFFGVCPVNLRDRLTP
ncbi:MAG: hypothetical protein QGI87_01935 [Candidatus Bathyarchaeota archaeon]|nr:hypothetical protein [Candidatus Bathyarchaeota archaeon]MDP7443098.1 hypothetical protein [Candidatus Bathyarchaeota archaeon]